MTQQPSNRTKLESAIAALGIDLELTGTEIADIFWLVLKQREFTQEEPLPRETPSLENSMFPFAREEGEILPPVASPETTPIYADLQSDRPRAEYGGETLPLRVPDAPSLREPLNFVRSLRPLMSRVNSGRRTILDEVATARETARQGICYPVLTSELEPWLDLALVVDENPSMTLWGHTLQELQRLFEGYGIFREVRVWGLQGESGMQLRSRTGQRFANPRELLDPSRRRLILIASDCVGVYWHDGSILPVLRDWARMQPLAILQMLPDWLWLKTGLRLGASVRLSSLYPGQANRDLAIAELLLWKDLELEKGINVPVLTLEPEVAAVWSQTLAGKSGVSVAGFVLPPELPRGGKSPPQARVAQLNARDRVKRFRQTASPVARKLAGLLSAAPVICLPVVRLLQAALLPQSQPIHVAEVFLGGLLQPIGAIAADTAPDTVQYRFVHEDIRHIFLGDAPKSDSQRVFDAVSLYIEEEWSKSLYDFVVLLKQSGGSQGEELPPFAAVSLAVLKELGDDYAAFAAEVEGGAAAHSGTEVKEKEFPPEPSRRLESFPVARVEVEETYEFEFDVAVLERQSRGVKGRRGEWGIRREKRRRMGVIEVLEEDIQLELMAIPAGTFLMGSPEDELERDDDESPQHEVDISAFFISRYPVTQEQWRIVAGWEPVERELAPDPSYFQEPYEKQSRWKRPVEQVSWRDAKEFCARLTRETGKEYRLPTEAEWEYACRGGTETPFHFGETISPKLANYDGDDVYGKGSKGEYRQQTTPVGYFKVANEFGLYDMHGNVLEWCEDDWHGNYEKAPTDGSAWLTSDEDVTKILRGGSWDNYPWYCRSAFRNGSSRANRINYIGFRIVRVQPRTL